MAGQGQSRRRPGPQCWSGSDVSTSGAGSCGPQLQVAQATDQAAAGTIARSALGAPAVGRLLHQLGAGSSDIPYIRLVAPSAAARSSSMTRAGAAPTEPLHRTLLEKARDMHHRLHQVAPEKQGVSSARLRRLVGNSHWSGGQAALAIALVSTPQAVARAIFRQGQGARDGFTNRRWPSSGEACQEFGHPFQPSQGRRAARQKRAARQGRPGGRPGHHRPPARSGSPWRPPRGQAPGQADQRQGRFPVQARPPQAGVLTLQKVQLQDQFGVTGVSSTGWEVAGKI